MSTLSQLLISGGSGSGFAGSIPPSVKTGDPTIPQVFTAPVSTSPTGPSNTGVSSGDPTIQNQPISSLVESPTGTGGGAGSGTGSTSDTNLLLGAIGSLFGNAGGGDIGAYYADPFAGNIDQPDATSNAGTGTMSSGWKWIIGLGIVALLGWYYFRKRAKKAPANDSGIGS